MALLLAPAALAAQDPLSRAFDLERRGSYAEAADIYRSVLKDKPAEISALLGLERSLTPLNRLNELIAPVQAAVATSGAAIPIYAVALRAYAAANLLDSLPRVVELWSRAAPGDEAPYREWAAAALQRRDRPMARRAYQLGRERVGKPDALAAEIAQLAVIEEDWLTAVREWARAVRRLPGYRSSAIATLSQAPEGARADILKALEKEPGAEPGRVAVDLRARWGDPVGALEALLRNLPAAPGQQIDILQAFLEEARSASTSPYVLAQARVLEAIADRWSSPAQRARLRLESARAYAKAGDRPAARRMLTRIAADSSSGPAVAAGATATLIELLVGDGKADEASDQLQRYRAALPVDDYLRLRRAIASRWAQAGDLDRAVELIAGDSSVEALALEGRFRLYAGDLKGVTELWKQAGPFAGTREEATERSLILALLQPIGPDTLLALGRAFQTLDGGDTLGAAKAFEQTGRSLPVDGGRAEATLFAGKLYGAGGRSEDAERTLRAAIVKEAPAAAAAASLELGRLLMGQHRVAEASRVLEQMILDHPSSALVPQARRLLDEARGAVPRT
jgi:tetratricopeptide (TPR) repeat protein